MRKLLTALAAVVPPSAILVTPAGAVQGATPDGNVSGGPIFHTDTAGNVWDVAVISFGTKYCNGTSGAFRLDNTQARTFLHDQGVPLN